MKFELFVARRIFSDKTNRRSVSQTIVRIALGGIALGVAVMILSVAIVTGFKQEISDKVAGFGSHIRVKYHDANSSLEAHPIERNQVDIVQLGGIRGIANMHAYAMKAGIVKTQHDIQGVVLKGVDSSYDWSFFGNYLTEGHLPQFSDSARSTEVLVSEYIAKLMKLKLGDKVRMYFIQNPPRLRRFEIVGIYNTGLEVYDKALVVCDIRQIQKLNDWTDEQITGYELVIEDFSRLDEIATRVRSRLEYDFLPDGGRLIVETIREIKPEIFTWLELTDINVVVILVLMLLVAGVNMISSLLILILERTQMIGILKSLGARNASVRSIFLYNAALLTGKGLFWGNLVGLGLALLQYYFKLIPLDPSSYYVNTVPINLVWWHVALLNVFTLITIVAMLVLPSLIVAKISPVKAIRFE